MKYFSFLLQRTCYVLCLLNFVSCSSIIKEWQFENIKTQCSKFNSGRLLLAPDSNCEYIELELVRNFSGIRFYVNLFFLQARSLDNDSARTLLEIIYDDESLIIYPYLLTGGQRILLDENQAVFLINLLKNDKEFTLKFGRHELTVIPTKFSKHYQSLLEIPI